MVFGPPQLVILLKHTLQLIDPFRESLGGARSTLLVAYRGMLTDQRFGALLDKVNEVTATLAAQAASVFFAWAI